MDDLLPTPVIQTTRLAVMNAAVSDELASICRDLIRMLPAGWRAKSAYCDGFTLSFIVTDGRFNFIPFFVLADFLSADRWEMTRAVAAEFRRTSTAIEKLTQAATGIQ